MSSKKKREQAAAIQSALEALSQAAAGTLQTYFHAMVPVVRHLESTHRLMEFMKASGFLEDPSDAAVQARQQFLDLQIADTRCLADLMRAKADQLEYPLEEALEAFDKLRNELTGLEEMRGMVESLDPAGLDALIEDLSRPRAEEEGA